MHRTDALRPEVADDPAAVAGRARRRERREAAEAVVAVLLLVMVLGMLAGWQLPV